MTPPFGLMMFWLPEMRMRPLWMSAVRRPRMMSTFVFPSLLSPLLHRRGPLLSPLLLMWLPNQNQKQHPSNCP